MDSLRAAVVGAGPNGLCAAVELARCGWSVVVHERAATIGGGARSAALTLPGYLHDVCSAIHPLAVGSPFLSALPLAQHGLRWIHPAAPLAHPMDDGPAVLLERDPSATAEGLGADGAAWRRLFEPLAARWDDLARELLAPPLHVPRSPLLLLRFGTAAVQSAMGLARQRFDAERARALLAGLAAHSALPLERAGSAAFALVLGAAGHAVGWPLPAGGAQSISNALVGHLRELGGRVETASHVSNLRELGPTPAAILLDLAPRRVVEVAGDRLAPRYARALRRYRHGPGVFKIDWALSGPIPWRDPRCARAATVHLGGTAEEIAAAERAPWEGRHAERPFVLLAQPSLFDPARAPACRHTGWAYCRVPAGSAQDMTTAIERQVERFAPGFRDLVIARSTRTAAEMERDNPNLVGGDIAGGVSDLRQLVARPVLRAVPYATSDPRIFICSSSTPPGGGVHGMCGWWAARAVMKKLP